MGAERKEVKIQPEIIVMSKGRRYLPQHLCLAYLPQASLFGFP